MRKKFLLTVLGLMTAVGLNAQVKVDRGNSDNGLSHRKSSQLAIKYGVKAGVNLSSMSNGMEFNPGFGLGVGFRAGVMANFHFGQRSVNSLPGTGLLGVQPELMYSYQSVKSDEGNINMSYIQLPVMLKVYPMSALSVEVGPEFNYLIGTSPETMVFEDATISVGDCKGFNMGLGVGVAYELKMGLVVGARYSLGFTDLAKNLKWNNNGNVQVTVGWLF